MTTTQAPTEPAPTDIGDVFQSKTARERIDALSPPQIEARRNEILLTAAGDYEKLSTEELHELAYIASRLRKTNVGPPKEPRARMPMKPRTVADLL